MVHSTLGRYAVAPLAVAVAMLIRLPLQSVLGEAVPYLLFFPAVAASAWHGGLGPGLLATTLSIVAAFFALPGLAFQPLDRAAQVSVPLFFLVGAVISGLTERLRRAERHADTERATLATTLLSIGDGIIVADASMRVTLVNGVAESLTGWSAADARGRHVRDVFRIVNEQTRRPVENPLERVMREGVITGLANHTVLIARDATERPIDDSAAPTRDIEGRIVGAVLVFRDVSARRQAEAEREAMLTRERAARIEAEAANRTREEFLATLSHELRTPLNAILGWARMLGEPSLDPARASQAIQVIQRNAEAQARLVSDLLDVSRFVTGKMRLAADVIDLPRIVEEAVDSIRMAADAKSIALRVDAGPIAAAVVGDADRLRQLVWNVLTNAVKFTPRGGHVDVTLQSADSHVRLTVRDDGLGIGREFLPHIFERFVQEDATTSRVHGGLGLGLALARQIAEAHGGTVLAASDGTGRGATFTVLLPAAAARSAFSDPASAPAPIDGANV